VYTRENATTDAAARSGQRSSGTARLTATQNAAADAEWPEGNEADDGIPTHRVCGTPNRERRGR